MNRSTFLALVSVAAIFVIAGTPKAKAQISVNIGVEPACPYGYYDYAPYRCAPYGYAPLMATTARNGFMAVLSLAWVPGSMEQMSSAAM